MLRLSDSMDKRHLSAHYDTHQATVLKRLAKHLLNLLFQLEDFAAFSVLYHCKFLGGFSTIFETKLNIWKVTLGSREWAFFTIFLIVEKKHVD